MNGFDYFKKCITKSYLDFDGRARRSEYWYFTLFNVIIIYGLMFLTGGMSLLGGGDSSGIGGGLVGILLIIYFLATVLPGIAVVIRRLHDVGKSGWMYFIILIPLIGAIMILVYLCSDSQAGENQYGPNPKEIGDGIDDHLI